MSVLCTAAALLTGSCGGDEGDAPRSASTSVVGTQAEQLAQQLDCLEVTSADELFENSHWGFTESLDCWIDDRPSIRIHTFDAAAAPGMARAFEQRYGPLSGCPSGEALAPQFVVVGDTWSVVTSSVALRDMVAERLDAVALQSGDDTTPISYPPVDPCPDSPPSSAPG